MKSLIRDNVDALPLVGLSINAVLMPILFWRLRSEREKSNSLKEIEDQKSE
jgi:hypothetical protein